MSEAADACDVGARKAFKLDPVTEWTTTREGIEWPSGGIIAVDDLPRTLPYLEFLPYHYLLFQDKFIVDKTAKTLMKHKIKQETMFSQSNRSIWVEYGSHS